MKIFHAIFEIMAPVLEIVAKVINNIIARIRRWDASSRYLIVTFILGAGLIILTKLLLP